MKKTGILIIFLILLSVSSANSQVLIGLLFGDKLNSPKTEFGLNGIYNTNTLSDISDPKNYRSYGFGLYLDYKISDKWIFSPSLFFKSPKGVRNFNKEESFSGYLADSVFTNANTIRKMNYVEIPILIRYQFSPRIGLAVGFDMGFLTSVADIISYNEYDGTFTYKKDVRDQFNSINFEAIAGLHYHFKGDPGAQIRLNYLYGLTNVYKEETGREGYTRTIQIGVMIPIKFGIGSESEGKE